MSKKVLLSGGSGFLGSVLKGLLLDLGHDVCTFGPAGRAAGKDAPHVHVADISSPEAHVPLLERVGPDWVFHVAGVNQSAGVREAYLVNSVWGGALLSALAERRPGCKCMVVGSAAEYGPQHNNPLSGRGWEIGERTECRPAGLYGVTKLAQTLHAASFADRLPVVAVRPFNIVGKGMPETLALGRFAQQIKALPARGGVVKTGPLDGVRDFVGVRECAATLISVMENPASSGKIMNICSEKGTRMRDLLELAIRRSGRSASVCEEARGNGEPDVYVGRAGVLKELGIDPPGADLPAVVDAMLAG